jgi:hypothetical protein
MVTYPLQLLIAVLVASFAGIAFFTYWLAKEICGG